MDTKDRTREFNTTTGRTDDLDRDSSRTNPDAPDANRDPITGAPGSHPIGTGVGATGGTAAGVAAGAAIGTAVAPGVGTIAGGVIGGIVGGVGGGLAGKGVAEAVNPTAEDAYWRENYKDRDYVDTERYEDYQPAYRIGWESCAVNRPQGRTFGQVESDLQREWPTRRGGSTLGWDKARNAARDAWDRVERAIPGDADRDGK